MEINPLYNEELKEWWERSRDGDSHAFQRIHRELFHGLYQYALKLLHDKDLASDAVQELFIRIWVRRERIGRVEKVKSYFFTSLRRQILNQFRNFRVMELRASMMPVPDFDFSPEEIVVRNEEDRNLHEKVLTLLNALPKRQKEVIYLHYFEGLDYSQIASIMGINYQSVLNLTQKALAKLRAAQAFSLLLIIATLYRSIHSRQ